MGPLIAAVATKAADDAIEATQEEARGFLNPLLAYFGHHKCGTSWITKIVEDVCRAARLKFVSHHYETFFDGDILALRVREPFDFWNYINADVNFTREVDLRAFHVVRDPRDVIVSAYFSHLYSHSDAGWARLRHYRPYLRSLSKHDGLLAEMEFNALFIAHMLMWDYSRPNILEVHFEDLAAAEEEGFEKIFRFLDLVPRSVSVEQMRAIVARHSFIQLSGGRPAGVEDAASHYRKGVVGDWRNHFEPAHVEYFKKLYNPVLLKLGYESYEDWDEAFARREEKKPVPRSARASDTAS
jgi:hypothetical protein